jgi:hypothetical protein
MIYQLPNGKIVHLTVEEFLDLTDQDIQALMSVNAGDFASSPFYGSAIRNRKKEEDIEEDKSIDFSPDLEEPLYHTDITENTEEDFPEFPEDMYGI